MKKLILGVVLSSIVLFSGSLFANTQVTLSWDPNAPKDKAIGYKVYDNMVEIDDVVGTTTIVVVPDGDHSFTVTCYNVNGESGHSLSVDRIYYTAVPGQPSYFFATDEIKVP